MTTSPFTFPLLVKKVTKAAPDGGGSGNGVGDKSKLVTSGIHSIDLPHDPVRPLNGIAGPGGRAKAGHEPPCD